MFYVLLLCATVRISAYRSLWYRECALKQKYRRFLYKYDLLQFGIRREQWCWHFTLLSTWYLVQSLSKTGIYFTCPCRSLLDNVGSWQHSCINKFQPMTAAKIRPTYHKTATDLSQKTMLPPTQPLNWLYEPVIIQTNEPHLSNRGIYGLAKRCVWNKAYR